MTARRFDASAEATYPLLLSNSLTCPAKNLTSCHSWLPTPDVKDNMNVKQCKGSTRGSLWQTAFAKVSGIPEWHFAKFIVGLASCKCSCLRSVRRQSLILQPCSATWPLRSSCTFVSDGLPHQASKLVTSSVPNKIHTIVFDARTMIFLPLKSSVCINKLHLSMTAAALHKQRACRCKHAMCMAQYHSEPWRLLPQPTGFNRVFPIYLGLGFRFHDIFCWR